ncbi:hypothetical protein ABZ622_21905 [Streptomyces sp. NPDC007164]|uniref:hypothetical protein n=1 Tax=Streptomyces sp. NPDC007164 TaxID=3156918 RepID=UPI00340AB8B5
MLLVVGVGLAGLAIVAVHRAALPLGFVVYADAVIVLCWLVVAVLLFRERRVPDAPVDDAGNRHHQAVRYSTDSEPLARSHWGTRHHP